MGTRGSFPKRKWLGHEADHSTSIYWWGQRMSRALPSLPQYAFMAWCSIRSKGTTLCVPYL